MSIVTDTPAFESGQRIAYLTVRRQPEGRRHMQPLKKVEFDEDLHLEPLPRDITWAAMLDVRNVEHEITELMIRRACEEMEDVQQFPFNCGDDEGRVVPRTLGTVRKLHR